MAEFCEKCLIKIIGISSEVSHKWIVKHYEPGEKDLCEGCGEYVIMRNTEKKNTKEM